MTRKFKRLKDLDVSLEIKNDGFIRPPRDGQRNWLLNKALNEFVADLIHLDALSSRFVPGAETDHFEDRSKKMLEEKDIMEDWQIPVMKAMVDLVTESHGDVLEVGFGRGVASTYIQEVGVESHTIIECNDFIVNRFSDWEKGYLGRKISLIHGKWQDVSDRLDKYDGILFHTYPLDEDEYVEYAVKSTTFAEHFFATAAGHLRPGGNFTYFTNEIDSLSRAHQRLLLEYFRRFSLSIFRPLEVPRDTKDAMWGDSVVLVKAVK